MATARVLIVDDEPMVLHMLEALLDFKGYNPISASTPSQALEIVRCSQPIDVVLSDVEMFDMRGPDLVREVMQLSPETACVLMTGGLVDSIELPPDVPLLHKPLSVDDVIAAIHEAIGRSTQLTAKLQASVKRNAELQKQSGRLISECYQVVHESAQTIYESRLVIEQQKARSENLSQPDLPAEKNEN